MKGGRRVGTLALAAGVLLGVAPARAADAGARTFPKCYACHSLDPAEETLQGPTLHGVVGRRAAGVAGFDYSPAMRAAGAGGLIWNAETLDAFLAAPGGYLPHTAMSFPGLKHAAERAAIINYLQRTAR